MDTTAVTSSSSATQGDSASAAAKNVLGKDDFLKLLTAQLANQDPLQPVDNQAFIAQLAQFSSLEQLQNVTSRLDTLLLATASNNQLSTASLVGKSVSYKTSSVALDGTTAPGLSVKLDANASVTCLVQDASGRTVRSLVLGARDAGTFDLGFDGRDASGAPLPAGQYTLQLSARDAQGQDVAVEARGQGRVTGITFDGGAAELLIGQDHVKLSDVSEITQA
ncbi:flagellar hook assembly protein FlgD [Anaeromyxobacter diazotrophicus]|uniref:Basal-body rod modification protein FlgD n=1 Tax=Anaeromyxobacter diazotrophicus TaxID=2590199 RepID=A0A7I9VLI3_9BACT|nr:flagellar hook capping FlgD N-terminal domain-containing protein [Anaeromyxobacter diazotrophicus]GEJ56990.1 basal-body rod modification protein FlgD [Anaeromyxobacter diazotrophicus]